MQRSPSRSTLAKSYLRVLQGLTKWVTGQRHPVRPDCIVETTFVGTHSTGWNLVPQLLTGNATVFSLGLGGETEFERSLLDDFGCTVHGFDPDIESLKGLASWAPEDFVAHLMKSSGDGKHYELPQLALLARELGIASLELLKLDLRGAEGSVLEGLLDSTLRPTQLALEFRDPEFWARADGMRKSIAELRAEGYVLHSISPSGTGFSFLRREFLKIPARRIWQGKAQLAQEYGFLV